MQHPHPDSLQDRVVLITGGSRGFGWHIARALLERGARVALTGTRHTQAWEPLHQETEMIAGPGRCLALSADVRDADACDRAVEEVMDAFGRIDVLINNAGRGSSEYGLGEDGRPRPFWEVTPEAWRSVLDTNLTGAFLMTRATVPHMMERGFGKIFSISTSLTTMVGSGLSPYGASKAGLETAHVVWARELTAHGIDVNILLPGGASDTDFIAPAMVPGEVGARSDRLLPGDVIVPPAVWLCTDDTNGLSGRRIIARFWDANKPPAEAFADCLQPQHEHPVIM